ncbi:MAG: inorganic pyrophosphatase [Lactobacillales bacterium]|jgi:inorganic pyrophosphatase|nr:inorganic pyrophosphatase [Lactobacillales bacterium]
MKVKIDRPIGFIHHGAPYPINYGYVEGVIGGDGEEQDCYVLGRDIVDPLAEFEGELIAIIYRSDDVETKWVVSNEHYTADEIRVEVNFMEQYFDSRIEMI